MNEDELKALVDEVAAASGYGGLDMGTMYGKFAFDVAKRAVLAERMACAKLCREIAVLKLDSFYGPGCCAQVADKCNVAILARSNK